MANAKVVMYVLRVCWFQNSMTTYFTQHYVPNTGCRVKPSMLNFFFPPEVISMTTLYLLYWQLHSRACKRYTFYPASTEPLILSIHHQMLENQAKKKSSPSQLHKSNHYHCSLTKSIKYNIFFVYKTEIYQWQQNLIFAENTKISYQSQTNDL